jgi:hypothetical protein
LRNASAIIFVSNLGRAFPPPVQDDESLEETMAAFRFLAFACNPFGLLAES